MRETGGKTPRALLTRLDAMRVDALTRRRSRPPGEDDASSAGAADRGEVSETERIGEIDREVDSVVEATLQEIEVARQRAIAGTYGRCVNCGDPIASERLAALPSAIGCIPCQTETEASGWRQPG